MKKKFIFPKFSIISFITSIVLIVFWYIVHGLESRNYYFCFGTLHTETIYFIILCIGTALLLCSIVWLILKNIKNKWISVPITAIVALFAVCYLGLTFWSTSIIDTELIEFTSPNEKHNIIIAETSHLHGGRGQVFEKTSYFTMKKVGEYSFNHIFNPVNKGEFYFVWSAENFELHYKGNRSDEYDILKMEYIK